LINENPDKYRTFALECANVPEALAETYPTPTFTANCVPTEAQIARVNDWLVEKELLAEPYDYEQMVDDSFMK
ncbi:MAG: metal ABC transporter substrate-binding protein, partial [Peptococcaceae bacterium]|nr:metal ABC transporter substrate-binding protein [Peptococcaceae bacterium]